EPLLELLHRLLDAFGDCDGVRTWDLEDADRTGGFAVESRALLVIERSELDPADVLHTDDRAIGVQAHDDVAELLPRNEAALRADGVRELLPLGRGLGADASGRVDRVLLFDGVQEIGDREPQARQTLWLDPDAHGVVGGAVVLDLPHAGDAVDRVVDV